MEVNLYPSRPQFSRAKKYLFNIENLVLRASPRSRLAGVRMQWPCRYRCEISWSPGVFEYWSVGKNESRNLMRIGLFITPLLHYSTTPTLQQTGARRKEYEAPSGANPKPGLPRRSHGEGGSLGSELFTRAYPTVLIRLSSTS
jgi:hypothetical protein